MLHCVTFHFFCLKELHNFILLELSGRTAIFMRQFGWQHPIKNSLQAKKKNKLKKYYITSILHLTLYKIAVETLGSHNNELGINTISKFYDKKENKISCHCEISIKPLFFSLLVSSQGSQFICKTNIFYFTWNT